MCICYVCVIYVYLFYCFWCLREEEVADYCYCIFIPTVTTTDYTAYSNAAVRCAVFYVIVVSPPGRKAVAAP